MKKILITGATGFIGSHLVNRLLELGKEIGILALPGDKKAADYERRGIEVVYGDITDEDAVNRALKDVQTVFHLAAVVTDWAPKILYDSVNVRGTDIICRLSLENKVERLVYMSTNDVFGLREDVVMDESFCYSRWGEPYPDSKLKASEIVWSYHKQGLQATMIYPCWVYGPGDTTFLVPLVDAIKKGELVFWRKGALIWPAYIDNVIDMLIEVSSNPRASGEGFLIHDGIPDNFEYFVGKIAGSLNLKCPRLYLPFSLAFAAAFIMENIWRIFQVKSRPVLTTYIVKNLAARWRFSITKAQTVLGWNPPVTYEDGLKRTIKWLKAYCFSPKAAQRL